MLFWNNSNKKKNSCARNTSFFCLSSSIRNLLDFSLRIFDSIGFGPLVDQKRLHESCTDVTLKLTCWQFPLFIRRVICANFILWNLCDGKVYFSANFMKFQIVMLLSFMTKGESQRLKSLRLMVSEHIENEIRTFYCISHVAISLILQKFE